jgi:hypothetical protein
MLASTCPAGVLFRLARGIDPFAPPEWERASLEDGTFGNRFDDPTALDGRPPERRFRAIYCATQRIAAFGETLARFRVSPAVLAGLDAIEDEESTEEALAGAVDPRDRTRGFVSADWRFKRRLGQTTLAPDLVFADVADHRSLSRLRIDLRDVAAACGIDEIDLSALTSGQRRFTQRCARHIHDLRDDRGRPRFAGLRYVSRLDAAWECWAIFDDRFRHTPSFPDTIAADDPDLLAIARVFRLTIEVFPGSASYLRP